MRRRRLLLTLVIAGVSGCAKPLAPDAACALASAIVAAKPLGTGWDALARNPRLAGCESFASSGDGAMIQVLRDYEYPKEHGGLERTTIETYRQAWNCNLRRFDQGWRAIECARQR